MTNILECRELTAQRGFISVLSIPHLAIQEGEVLALIGPNGAGKSTLLLALARLIKASGTMLFRGEEVGGGLSELAYRRRVTMVFQEPLLLDTTVEKNVATGLKLRGMKRAEIDKRVQEALERFGIGHLIYRHARKLSSGEAKRVSLARAFALRPEIVFLDEPFSPLDPPTREGLLIDLKRALRETNTTAVVATHEKNEALVLSQRVCVMNDGQIVQMGSPVEVMNHPADEFVASFVGVETIIPAVVLRKTGGILTVKTEKDLLLSAVGDQEPGERVLCCLRPEQVTILADGGREHTSARNLFSGKIVELASLGMFWRVTLDCGFPLIAYVTGQAVEELGLKIGACVSASFKATAVHVIKVY